ncbi:hypothetical protein BpHYR1_008646 [Brachionus plicatilis]|uniref:Uncharacterized protein n=1 Tax=Brachionus plicatilis TaxID=10195 RepID=A0A3M7TAS1_BRAPC|nr:hypothetical protein BpHYR1_008646 [Brachionus plicatilis]
MQASSCAQQTSFLRRLHKYLLFSLKNDFEVEFLISFERQNALFSAFGFLIVTKCTKKTRFILVLNIISYIFRRFQIRIVNSYDNS